MPCWKCSADLHALPRPFGRRAECPACHAELHVCRMCRHFAPGKSKQCMEPMAEEVKDKIRANFCDWFQEGPNGAAPGKSDAAATARKALDDLFGS
jgi:hypothetical protein